MKGARVLSRDPGRFERLLGAQLSAARLGVAGDECARRRAVIYAILSCMRPMRYRRNAPRTEGVCLSGGRSRGIHRRARHATPFPLGSFGLRLRELLSSRPSRVRARNSRGLGTDRGGLYERIRVERPIGLTHGHIYN